MEDIVSRLREFMNNEARSCSMDYRSITPLYVYRIWGECVEIEEIESMLYDLK